MPGIGRDRAMTPTPPYPCTNCTEGLVLTPTMAVETRADGVNVVGTAMAPRHCKACKGVGRVWHPPETPPVP